MEGYGSGHVEARSSGRGGEVAHLCDCGREGEHGLFLMAGRGVQAAHHGAAAGSSRVCGCVALDGGKVGHIPSVDGGINWWSRKYPTCDNSKAWF